MKYQFLGYHPIRNAYLLTVSAISDGFDAQIPFTDGGHGKPISAWLPISGSCRNSISGRTSKSEIAAELRPSRTVTLLHLRTMDMVGSNF